ncbi:outer membrane protein [Ketogulonicigenium vulgare]|nr:porin family protein [Ketogulonicigenium vulgare]AOZ53271.1 outer membrane protein [Ketogulonicigenium vulgare]
MRYICIAAFLASTSAIAANAGGLSTPVMEPPVIMVQPTPMPAPSWQGAYVGANVNYGDLSVDSTGVLETALQGAGFDTTVATADGVNYAIRGGYDWQFNNWLFGLGGEYSFGSYDGGLSGDLVTALGTDIDLSIDSVATAYLRAGYAFSQSTAAYLLVGYTWATAEATLGGTTYSEDYEAASYGLGVEHRFNRAWSVYGEYVYTDFGDINPTNDPTYDNLAEADLGQFKIGVNFRF